MAEVQVTQEKSNGAKNNEVRVWDRPTEVYVLAVERELRKANTVAIVARGKFCTPAITVAEIVRKDEVGKIKNVGIGSEQVQIKDKKNKDKKINVVMSSIKIELEKV